MDSATVAPQRTRTRTGTRPTTITAAAAATTAAARGNKVQGEEESGGLVKHRAATVGTSPVGDGRRQAASEAATHYASNDTLSPPSSPAPSGARSSPSSPPPAFSSSSSPDSLATLLKRIINQDVDSLRLPIPLFLIEPVSNLAYLARLSQLESFIHIADAPSDVDQILAVTRVLFASLKRGLRKTKKPLNPVLGETYDCEFRHPDLPTLKLRGEQVSHHPPVSAYDLSCPCKDLTCLLVYDVKARFTGTHFALHSNSMCRIRHRHRVYHVTYPNAYATGVLSLMFKLVWTGSCEISCEETGLQVRLRFREKRWWGRDSYEVTGEVVRVGAEGGVGERKTGVVAEVDGRWDETVFATWNGRRTKLWSIHDPDGYTPHPPSTHNSSASPRTTSSILASSSSSSPFPSPLHSTNIWTPVLQHLPHNPTAAAAAKHAIESQQRALARDRLAKGEVWRPKRFWWDGTSGHWRVREDV